MPPRMLSTANMVMVCSFLSTGAELLRLQRGVPTKEPCAERYPVLFASGHAPRSNCILVQSGRCNVYPSILNFKTEKFKFRFFPFRRTYRASKRARPAPSSPQADTAELTAMFSRLMAASTSRLCFVPQRWHEPNCSSPSDCGRSSGSALQPCWHRPRRHAECGSCTRPRPSIRRPRLH